jgi:hypothetical protein
MIQNLLQEEGRIGHDGSTERAEGEIGKGSGRGGTKGTSTLAASSASEGHRQV